MQKSFLILVKTSFLIQFIHVFIQFRFETVFTLICVKKVETPDPIPYHFVKDGSDCPYLAVVFDSPTRMVVVARQLPFSGETAHISEKFLPRICEKISL